MLDFTPNAVHAGIYTALHEGYDRDAGVRLQVEQPAESTDSIKLLAAGRVDFAILDIHDLAIADSQRQNLVGVLAFVQRPLAAVIAQPAVANPKDLEGKTAGVTGAPSDEAVLDSVLAGAGANPHAVKRVNIGFQAVPTMLANRVDAATAFWNVEGLELGKARPGTHEFRVDEYGAPSYPELVLCVTKKQVHEHPALVHAVVSAVVRGYELTMRDPKRSVANMLAEVPGLDPPTLSAQLAALQGAFQGTRAHYGELDPATLASWATWEARFGIVSHRPDVGEIFDDSFVH